MMMHIHKAAISLCYQFITLQSRQHLTRRIREKQMLQEKIICEICNCDMKSVSHKSEHMLKKHRKELDEQVSSVIGNIPHLT